MKLPFPTDARQDCSRHWSSLFSFANIDDLTIVRALATHQRRWLRRIAGEIVAAIT